MTGRSKTARRIERLNTRLRATLPLPGLALKAVVLATGCLAAATSLSAQQGNARLEVASVKPTAPNSDGFGIYFVGDTVRTVGAPVEQIAIFAYGLSPYDSPIGLPEWARRDGFDIVAKTAGSVTPDGRRAMVRQLLAERFNFVAHTEQRQLDALALVRTKPGTALPRTLEPVKCQTAAARGLPPCITTDRGDELKTAGLTMDALAEQLRSMVKKRVVNQTGLEGHYKFTVSYPPVDPTDPIGGAQKATAITDQLQLKLVPAKAAVSVLVVDKVRRPTPD